MKLGEYEYLTTTHNSRFRKQHLLIAQILPLPIFTFLLHSPLPHSLLIPLALTPCFKMSLYSLIPSRSTLPWSLRTVHLLLSGSSARCQRTLHHLFGCVSASIHSRGTHSCSWVLRDTSVVVAYASISGIVRISGPPVLQNFLSSSIR